MKDRNLYQRISDVMREATYVQKNGYNAFHKYKYATEADYIQAIRPMLLKHGLVIVPVEQTVTYSPGNNELVTTQMKFRVVNVDNPSESIDVPSAGQGADKGDKAVFKSVTGAKKYLLSTLFLIETGDDPEADISVDKRAADKTAPKTEAAPAKASEPVATPAAASTTAPATEAKKTGGFKPGKPISNGTAAAPAKTTTTSAGDSW